MAPLANAIRGNPEIIGLLLGNTVYKISQFADDTHLLLCNEKLLQVALGTIERFNTCSGLKLNRDKSEAMCISASPNFRHKPCGIKWTDRVTSLGVSIGNDLNKYVDENFKTRINRIENLAKQWCLRKLILKGKMVVNTLFLAQLLSLSTSLYTPKWVIEQFLEIITTFIWNGKPPKVKYTAMINSIEYGELNLQDLSSKINAIRVRWIKKENKSP
jgi:hypothetical protein